MRRCHLSCVLVVSCVVLSGSAQDWISVGVKGGVPLTDPFADRSVQQEIRVISPNPFPSTSQVSQTNAFNSAPPPGLSQTMVFTAGPLPPMSSLTTRFYSGSRNFVLGPTLELRLPLGLAVEADALYRPMEFKVQQTSAGNAGLASFLLGTSPGSVLVGQVNAWEFPILAKYRLPLPVFKPYAEAGPSFRATGTSVAKHMSRTGVSAGIGVETRVGPLLVAPEVRYTHWGADGAYGSTYHVTSYPNQVEFLMGVATNPEAAGTVSLPRGGWRKLLTVGVKGGWPFTTAFLSDSYAQVTTPSVRCGDFIPQTTPCSASNATVETHRASRGYLVGPSVEVHLPLHLSVEGDALYGPLSLVIPGGGQWFFSPSIQTYASWSFPIVGKYRFQTPFVQPYLEAGPDFRTAASAIDHYLAKTGVTAGVGVEGRVWKIRISPEVRFVHWGADAPDAGIFYASRRNQAQFLLGVSY
jgi:hypothetical protein